MRAKRAEAKQPETKQPEAKQPQPKQTDRRSDAEVWRARWRSWPAGPGGIGTATSVRLGQQGVSVVVGDLNGEAALAVAGQITGAGGRAVGVTVDISDETAVADMVALAVDTYGGLDILHANAADLSADTLGRDSNALDVPLDAFDRAIAVNLRGHLLAPGRHPRDPQAGGRGHRLHISGAAFMGEPERPPTP